MTLQSPKFCLHLVFEYRYSDLSEEICAIRGCALLNLFEIHATDMNQNMSAHAIGLRDDLIKWQVIISFNDFIEFLSNYIN